MDQVPITTHLPPIKPEHEVSLDTGGGAAANMSSSTADNGELRDVFDRIKTHFPPAKVKKIMQSDEDIGKVSQATPVIAGRSLEFFIALLVKKSGETARGQGTKRITAEILKKTILNDEKFDFLREGVCAEEDQAKEEEEEEESA
ncbi:Bur6p [Saccharomyces cerevisiae x Saccharomyces kudriavzevii VIN7]|uniref:Bur6p n=1 Tax=Saccharomyces cerevisiae x Saccharomyces kudriavzevii (strain VIN7) TaxID=1095631 RepID=H0GU44_SACCK|nr:Bur6p [Saccharomyces cerevisiae x Saccharomyces kudriavzevii VIN7]